MEEIIISAGSQGMDTKVFNAAGEPIRGIRRLTVHIDAQEPTTAEVEFLFVALDCKAIPRFVLKHPVDGKPREVAAIHFADGSVWEAA